MPRLYRGGYNRKGKENAMVTNPNFHDVQLKVSLGTRKVLAEAVKLAGADNLGRPIPQYAVLHDAIVIHRDKLKAEKQKRKG